MKIVHLAVEPLDVSRLWEGDEGADPKWLPEEVAVSLSEADIAFFSDAPEYPLEEQLALVVRAHLRENFHSSWWEYIHFRRRRQKRFALLLAHGSAGEDGHWYFWDGDTSRRVQDWIDEQDGKFARLIVFACNPGHITVGSRKSLLVIADRDVTLREGPGGYHFSLIDPRFGEVDEYTIDHRLALLRGKESEKSVTKGGV